MLEETFCNGTWATKNKWNWNIWELRWAKCPAWQMSGCCLELYLYKAVAHTVESTVRLEGLLFGWRQTRVSNIEYPKSGIIYLTKRQIANSPTKAWLHTEHCRRRCFAIGEGILDSDWTDLLFISSIKRNNQTDCGKFNGIKSDAVISNVCQL